MRTAKSFKNKIIFNLALIALLSNQITCEDIVIDHRITNSQEGIFDKMQQKMAQKEQELQGV